MASQTTGLATVAGRYASALLDLAEEAKAADRVADDLRALGRLIAESADLRRLVRSPVLAREAQERAILAVLEKAGAADLTRRFVAVTTRHRRLFALPEMIESYLAELARRRGDIEAEVTAAIPLDDAQLGRLRETLRRAVGRNVAVELKVDPRVIGGLIVRVGSRMVDSSLRTKLQRLEFALKGIG